MNMEKIKKELDLSILEKEKDKEYISKLNRTVDKVKYLRFIKGYTQMRTAEIIGISLRHVQRIDRIIRESNL